MRFRKLPTAASFVCDHLACLLLVVYTASQVAQGQSCINFLGSAGECQETEGCPNGQLWQVGTSCPDNVISPSNEINFLKEYCCVPYSPIGLNAPLSCKSNKGSPCGTIGGYGEIGSRCCDTNTAALFCQIGNEGSELQVYHCGAGACIEIVVPDPDHHGSTGNFSQEAFCMPPSQR
jgi:hypothetical protein